MFRRFYGPTHKAYAALELASHEQLTEDVAALLALRITGRPDSLVIPDEYFEVVVPKKQ